MAGFDRFLALLFFICLFHGGYSCTNADLKISSKATGSQVQGRPEFQVTIENTCFCVFKDVVLNCGGFQTLEPIDPSILTQNDADCNIVNNGNPIAPNSALVFNYAWDQSYNFTLKDAQVACSK